MSEMIASFDFYTLARIFTFLRLHDRRNVRLVCRQWNEACNSKKVIADEKFVFRPGNVGDTDSLREFGVRIESAECKTPMRSCWEFQGLRLFTLPTTVWIVRGRQVRSLFVYSCEVDNETIADIITHCFRLEHFRLQTPTFLPQLDGMGRPLNVADAVGFKRRRAFCAAKTISGLVELGIVRTSLVSLELYQLALLVSNDTLRELFIVFPSIRKFGQGYASLEQVDAFPIERYALKANLEGEWVLPPMVDTFISNRYDMSDTWRMPNTKFKELSTMLNMNLFEEERTFLDFFFAQTKLEKLALYLAKGESVYSFKGLIFHLLRGLPLLKELEIHSDNSNRFLYSCDEFRNFFSLTRGLVSLVTSHGFIVDIETDVVRYEPTQYTALKKLNLGSTSPHITCEILRRCCRSLQHLVLDYVNSRVMQTILEFHKELRILVINLEGPFGIEMRFVGRLRDSPDPGSIIEVTTYSLSKLRNLQHLRITDVNPLTIQYLLCEFRFPKLRYFDFYCREWSKYLTFSSAKPSYGNAIQVFGLMLEVLLRNAPYLEILRLRSCLYRAEEFAELFKRVKSKYLRFIIIDDLMSNFSKWHPSNRSQLPVDWNFGDIESVFVECPSLRLINFFQHGRYTFSYDHSTKKVKRYPFFNAYNPVQP